MTEQTESKPEATKALSRLGAWRRDLTQMGPYFQSAVPTAARKHLPTDRIAQIVCTAMSRSPKLLECTRDSMLRAVMDCAQIGLEPAGPLGHAYLVPFRNNKINAHEATAMIGYKGYVELAYRSGALKGPPIANLVYGDDVFTFNAASGRPPKHSWDIKKAIADRGAIVGAYCVSMFTAGGSHFEWMGIDELEKTRKRSRASSNGPWVTDTAQMQRKTVIRRARNHWPISADAMSRALMVDDFADDPDSVERVYDVEFESAMANLPPEDPGDAGQGKSGQVAAQIAGS